jgi:hypothetical protein
MGLYVNRGIPIGDGSRATAQMLAGAIVGDLIRALLKCHILDTTLNEDWVIS